MTHRVRLSWVRSVAWRLQGFEAALARWLWLWLPALALLVRLPGLGDRPLWYDESFAVLFSAKGPAAMVRGTLAIEQGIAADVHPLLYYSALWLWQRLLGSSPIAVRSLSVLLGLGIVLCGALFAGQLFDRRVAVWAGVFLALSPFQVHYSQEARMYALLAILLLGATLFLWKGLHGGRPGDWIGFSLLAAAAQYTHNLAFCYLLPLGLTPLLARRWRGLLYTALAGLAAGLMYLPWLLRVPAQLARLGAGYWIRPPGAVDLVRTLLVYVAGLPIPKAWLPVVLFAALLALLVGAVATLRGLKRPTVEARRAVWLAFLALAPVVVMFAVSLWRPIYLDRAMLPAGTAFALWLAWALRRGPASSLLRGTAGLAAAAAIVIGLSGFFTYRGFPYAPFAEVNESLRARLQAGELILHSNKITAIPAVYYGPDLDHHYLADPPGFGSDTLALATQEVLGLIAVPQVETAVGEARGVWFVIFPSEIADYQALGMPGHPALDWLRENFGLDSQSGFGELRVYHFVHQGGQ